MYGFSLEKLNDGITVMGYRRYETRSSGLIVVDNLGSTAVLTDPSQRDSGIHMPDFLETALFGGETSQTGIARIASPENDTLQDGLGSLKAAARLEWQSALEAEDPLAVRIFLAEKEREGTPAEPDSAEFVGYVATPPEIMAIEGIAAHIQGLSTNKYDEPGTGLYL